MYTFIFVLFESSIKWFGRGLNIECFHMWNGEDMYVSLCILQLNVWVQFVKAGVFKKCCLPVNMDTFILHLRMPMTESSQ